MAELEPYSELHQAMLMLRRYCQGELPLLFVPLAPALPPRSCCRACNVMHVQRSVAQPACLRPHHSAPCTLFACAAAAQAAVQGTTQPLVNEMQSKPAPKGGPSWPMDVPVLMSHVVGAPRRQVALDQRVRVTRGAGGDVLATEAKISAAGEAARMPAACC